MTTVERQQLRVALEALRLETVAEGPARIEPNRKDPSSVGVADEDEQALSEMLQTLASQRNRKQAELLGLIDRALRKLEESGEDFGSCEDCEEAIPGGRLRVLPYAQYCAECQGKRDARRGSTRRSLTEFK